MKNVFGVNTENQNAKIDGYLFVERRIDIDLAKKQDQQQQKLEEYQKSAQPKFLEGIKNTCFYIFLFCLFLTVMFLLSKNRNVVGALVSLSVGVSLLIVSLIIIIVVKKKTKKIVESEEFKATISESERVYQESLSALKIDETAIVMDLFLYMYKEKDGKIKPASPLFDFINFSCKIFKENNKIMIADSEAVLGFEKSSFKEIKRIDKKIKVHGWNKEFGINEGRYKDYKMTLQNGLIVMRGYYSLAIDYMGNDYEIFVPLYELDTIRLLTGLEVKTAE